MTAHRFKKDNSDITGKVMIREWLIQELGGATNCNVLELFGGDGHIHDACYKQVHSHLAFDTRKIDRPNWLQGDNKILLPMHATGWNLFDADAYANPWPIVSHVHRLTDQSRYAVVVTDGIQRPLNAGEGGGFVRQRINYNGMTPCGLLTRWYDDIVRWIISDWSRYDVTVEQCKRLTSKESYRVHYYGFIVNKKQAHAQAPTPTKAGAKKITIVKKK